MRRAILTGLGAALLMTAGAPARAQYWGGWRGWGGGATTAPGDIARGMGVFNVGVGERNLLDAQAGSINSTTAMRWNNYEWAVATSLVQDYNRRLIEKNQENAKSVNEIRDRLRNNPTPGDIADGRALNAILDDFQHPQVQAEALKVSERRAVPASLVKQIPFFYMSDPFTFSLHQFLDGDVEIPRDLRGEEFRADLKAIKELADKARQEDLESPQASVSEETARRLSEATRALRKKFEAKYGPNTPQYARAEPFLKALTGFTTLLRSSNFEKELAELKADQQVTLYDLLSFMTAFNLRFAPAKTPEQRAAYTQLYPILAERRAQLESLIAQHAAAGPGQAAVTGAPPTHLFQQLDFDQLDRSATPAPPRPRGNR